MKVRYTKELLEEAVKDCYSFAELARRLGLSPEGSNPKTLKKKLELFNVDYSHFTGQGWNVGLKFKPRKRKKIEDIMTNDSSYQSYKLLTRMINEGIRERRCECCGRTEWNNKEIPLQLHHIDGNRHNNTPENVQILCPNCHAQTDNFCGRKNRITDDKNPNHKKKSSI
jgi:heterodisulfide reductase subunit B